MRYWYIAIAVLAVLLLAVILWVLIRRRCARKRVCCRTDEEKCRDLNGTVGAWGFRYDLCQDIFYSRKDAWQRQAGYGRFYDEHAIAMGMVFECEPFCFVYGGRQYLFEVWKGQYGMSTGAEIGLYVSDEINEEHPEKLFYRSVPDEEMLSMRFVLRKQGRILMMREERHWWLTGFVLGEFSQPDELGMEIAIRFQDAGMQKAFCGAMLRAGYPCEEICSSGNRVYFRFLRPHTAQVRHGRLRVRLVQFKNRRNCRRYLHVTRCFTRTIDRVDYLGMCFPLLYRRIGRCSKIRRKRKA